VPARLEEECKALARLADPIGRRDPDGIESLGLSAIDERSLERVPVQKSRSA
jgi:hypothetical protein